MCTYRKSKISFNFIVFWKKAAAKNFVLLGGRSALHADPFLKQEQDQIFADTGLSMCPLCSHTA